MYEKEDRRRLKSDDYRDREKLGIAIIFMVKCEPYKGIEKALKIPKEIHEEYIAWEEARKVIELAKLRDREGRIRNITKGRGI